jgi:DNA-binding CsgD family transcriptional regulator/tetratricopeptide (TPR) repeat protein
MDAAVKPGRLLERDAVLVALRTSLVEVSAGHGRLVLVAGEAGVGKSTVARIFGEEASASARVLWGSCDALFTPRPLGPFLDIADDARGGLETAVEQGPPEVVSALLRLPRSKSATVVVVEDVHWADEASLDTLRLLVRKLARAPLLVLATYRETELDRVHPLRILLGELATLAHVERLTIHPLSVEAVAQLAGPAGVDAGELHRLTGGNPFYVTEVLASGEGAIPATVRDAVLARAARLSDEARDVLDAVAIVPPQMELWLLEALAGEHLPALEECLSSGMLVESGTAVGFRHELARLAIEESLSPQLRLRLHRRTLAALTRPPTSNADPSRLAHHAEAAGDAEAVVEYAPAAAESASAHGAHREAAAQFARALRFGDAFALERQAELYARRADECYLSSQFDEAVAAQERAVELRRELGDVRAEGDALRALSRFLFFSGRTEEGESIAGEAVNLLERLPPGRELAIAYANLSQRRMVVEDRESAIEFGTRALALAEHLDDPETRVYALTNLAGAEASGGGEHGLRKLADALSLARQHDLDDHAGRIFQLLVYWPLRNRRFDLVEEYLDAGLAYCGERGLETWWLYLLADRAWVELMLGRWDDAGTSAAAVLRDPRCAPNARGWALTVLGLLRARRGDPEALAPIEEAQRLAATTAELMRIGPPAAALAELDWLNGDSRTASGKTDAALALALERHVPWMAGELAYWRHKHGIVDQLAPELGGPWALQLAGDWARAAEQWHALGCPYDEALALSEGNDQYALLRALAMCRELGAKPLATIISRRLRDLGFPIPRGARASTRANAAALTAREIDVLQLVADGKRNTAIAEQLFLSARTVEHHVSAILRKLDVQSRGEAVAEAGRLGLLKDT